MLGEWLGRPHVHRWWFHDPSPEAVQKDFGPYARGEEPGEDLVVSLDGEPIGIVQRSRFADFPEDREPLLSVIEVPPEAVTVDYFIADPDRIGQGLGPAMIGALVADVWVTYPDAPCVITPVVAGNRPSWRALEKAGFARVGACEMEPDNPVDHPLHYVYRIVRPE